MCIPLSHNVSHLHVCIGCKEFMHVVYFCVGFHKMYGAVSCCYVQGFYKVYGAMCALCPVAMYRGSIRCMELCVSCVLLLCTGVL